MDKRLDTIDNIKVIMMLTVVVYHCCAFFTGSWFNCVPLVYKANYISYFAKWLNTFHVQTFTMASGFIYYALKKQKYKNGIAKDTQKRARRLLLPYFSTMLLWVVPFYVVFYGFHVEDLIYKFVLGCAPSQLWFLPMLFWSFIIFYFVFEIHEATNLGLIIVFVISVCGTAVLNLVDFPNILQVVTAVNYLIFYYLGGFLCEKKIKFRGWHSVPFLILSIIGFTVNIQIQESSLLVCKVVGQFLNCFCSISGIMFVYCLIKQLGEKDFTNYKIWKKLKSNSFGIYLFHQQIVYLTILIFNGRVPPPVHVVFSFATTIILSSLLVDILKKWNAAKQIFEL